MKYFYLLSLSMLSFFTSAQHYQFGTYISGDFPNKSIMPKMSPVIGMGLHFSYKPSLHFPMSLEAKGSLGIFSSRTLQQTYTFDGGSTTTADVTYSSSMNKRLLGLRFQIGNDFKNIRAYITPQIGLAYFRSKIVIADPAEQDDCVALDRRTNQRFNGMVYGGEFGIDVKMNSLFKGISNDGHRLFLSASFLSGFGEFEYVNVKYMQDGSHDAMEHGSHHADNEEGREITGTFINVSTNSLHDHKIAEVYRTSLQFWGFNIGYSFTF